MFGFKTAFSQISPAPSPRAIAARASGFAVRRVVQPPERTQSLPSSTEEQDLPTAPAESPTKSTVELPKEGGIYEENGKHYTFVTVPVGDKQVRNKETGQMEPLMYTLRTWFARETDEAGPGPGWDGRDKLRRNIAEGETQAAYENRVLRRYGHVPSIEETFNPNGRMQMSDDGELERVGGLPDIPYFKLVPLEETETVPTPG